VQPYTDQLAADQAQLRQELHVALQQRDEALRAMIATMNRPFECYVIGDKAPAQPGAAQ
jgi:hypothetical protein